MKTALESYHQGKSAECERAARQILLRQRDHPLGTHLASWALWERGEDFTGWLDMMAASPETERAAGIPAKATLGWLLWQAGRTREAIQALLGNVKREPQRGDLKTILGICFLADDQPMPARQVLRAVLDSSSFNPVARFHYAHALLHLGQWEEGFAELEDSRFQIPSRQPGPYDGLPEKQWKGQDLRGKSIVISGEQGFGDQIQFIRFARDLKTRFGASEVHFSCHQALAGLMSLAPSLDTASGKTLQGFDYHVPVMSLPHRCGARPDGHLFGKSWFQLPGDRAETWGRRLPRRFGKPRVGICWRSEPVNNPERRDQVQGINFVKSCKSLGSESLAFLLRRLQTCADLVSLQYEPSADELDALHRHGVQVPVIENFVDSAALVSLCDCVVTIDTAVAHLAGALNKETCLVLPKGADWRWSARDAQGKSLWYPSVTPFRQRRERDWQAAIEEVAHYLSAGVGQAALSS